MSDDFPNKINLSDMHEGPQDGRVMELYQQFHELVVGFFRIHRIPKAIGLSCALNWVINQAYDDRMDPDSLTEMFGFMVKSIYRQKVEKHAAAKEQTSARSNNSN